MICILASSDVPSGRSVLFGALAVALAAVVVGALWKVFAYGVGAAIGKALRKELGSEFSAINARLDHLHKCFEKRLGVVEAREASAQLSELRRIADAVARAASPARKTDPPDMNFLHERSLPPSEA